jgi:hypothetical protein
LETLYGIIPNKKSKNILIKYSTTNRMKIINPSKTAHEDTVIQHHNCQTISHNNNINSNDIETSSSNKHEYNTELHIIQEKAKFHNNQVKLYDTNPYEKNNDKNIKKQTTNQKSYHCIQQIINTMELLTVKKIQSVYIKLRGISFWMKNILTILHQHKIN